MKVLVVGSGGREHALVWKLAQSTRVSGLYAAPGNPGMAAHATLLPEGADHDSLVELAVHHGIELVVVGPEQPLVAGLVDRLQDAGIMAFGPHAAAARLEGSKRFSKDFMLRHGIPTAESRSFDELDAALEHLASLDNVPVVKLSGLAAGKGVSVAADRLEAELAIRAAFSDPTADGVVLEERLHGRELSLLGITDGRNWLPLPLAQDYKYAGEGDTGPMTGGMGAVAPAVMLSREQEEQVSMQIIDRTLAGLRKDGIKYAGVLFIGLMVTDDGVKVLEYNVRLGDPETQVVLPLLESDLLELLLDTCQGRLAQSGVNWSQHRAAAVVMAAPGYPATPERNIPLEPVTEAPDLLVFHAGTSLEEGQLVSSGGRVLNVVGLAPSMAAALERAYAGVSATRFPEAQWRRDIGLNLMED